MDPEWRCTYFLLNMGAHIPFPTMWSFTKRVPDLRSGFWGYALSRVIPGAPNNGTPENGKLPILYHTIPISLGSHYGNSMGPAYHFRGSHCWGSGPNPIDSGGVQGGHLSSLWFLGGASLGEYCTQKKMCLYHKVTMGDTDTPWKFSSSPLKIGHPKRKVVFQASFSKGLS